MLFHTATSEQTTRRKTAILISLLLIIVTATVYWQVQEFDFVNYDDGDYVYDNPNVQNGITFDSINWAFTATHASNWHPLTWLTHMLDCQMFGLWAGGHHLTNLFFHILNVLLLFYVFQKMTGDLWQSGFLAAIFALHPLHIQSVAWISERKDVLSAFFWMLTLWAYIRYVRRPCWVTYMWVLFFFILGLMSKPMVITLPFVMLLLDYWPLNRILLNGSENDLKLKITELLREKLPLFLLAFTSAGITFYVQQQAGSVKSLDVIPLAVRFPNVLISYINYMVKTVYPANLAAFYPYPDLLSWWQVTLAVVMLVTISGLSIRLIHRAPYIIVGWLWFIGTLIPVIGIVQVGIQSMADRYMYLPMIGLLIPLAWGMPKYISTWSHQRLWLGIPAIIIIANMSVITWKQIGYWKDSISLFSHAINVTKNNPVAHYNLGIALSKNGESDQAIAHYQQALALNPIQPEIYVSLGLAMDKRRDRNQALICFQKAALLDPENYSAQYNLGTFLFKIGQMDQALPCLIKAVSLKPDNDQAQFNLANVLFQKKRYGDALIHAQKTIDLNPSHEKAQQLTGTILYEQGQLNQALVHFNNALIINPESTAAFYYKGLILIKKKQIEKALASFKKALIHDPDNKETRQLVRQLEAKLKTAEQTILRELEINPNNDELHIQLGKIYQAQNLNDKAIDQYKLIIKQHPESIETLYNLAALHADQGQFSEAISYIKQAMSYQPDNPTHDYNMACLFARQNQISAAIEWLKKALNKGYKNWDQIRKDEDLQSIRNTWEFNQLIENRYKDKKTKERPD